MCGSRGVEIHITITSLYSENLNSTSTEEILDNDTLFGKTQGSTDRLNAKMDHSHMDHGGHGGHGDMDMGEKCSMSVSLSSVSPSFFPLWRPLVST